MITNATTLLMSLSTWFEPIESQSLSLKPRVCLVQLLSALAAPRDNEIDSLNLAKMS